MKVIKIKVPFQESITRKGIEFSKWGKENGLQFQKDYDYTLMSSINEIHVRFYDNNPAWETLVKLKFG